MKIKLEKLMVAFVVTFVMASCSSDDDNANQKNTPPVAKVTIKGDDLSIGETLTADTSKSTDEDEDEVTFTYQWYRADNDQGTGETEIEGATKKTYTLTADDQGKFITVKVIPDDGKDKGDEATSGYKNVEAKNTPPVAKVKITGTLSVGEILTADTSESTDEDEDEVTFTYQWYRADNDQGTGEIEIEGATKKTYTLTADDQGKYISVKVIPDDGKDKGEEAKSEYKKEAPTATIKGSLFVGQTLSVDVKGLSNKDKDNLNHQWYRADDAQGTGEAKIKVGSKYYRPKVDDQGKFIRVKVIPNGGKGKGEEIKSDYKKVEIPTATIKGSLFVGQTLSVDVKGLSNKDKDNLNYQWYRADDAQGTGEAKIEGATSKIIRNGVSFSGQIARISYKRLGSKTYTLTDKDKGKYISVKVNSHIEKLAANGRKAESDYKGPVKENAG